MSKEVLKLYITGRTERSESAITNFNNLCCKIIHDKFDLMVIDVLESPDQAEKDHILATPTLIRMSVRASRRIIGDLSDTAQVINGLGLTDLCTKND